MTVRLTFLCAAAGGRETAGDGIRGMRNTVLGDGLPSERVLRDAGAARASLPPYLPSLRAPSARCATVAAALGLEPEVEPLLRDIDYGAWRGRTVEEVAAADPDGYSVWLRDPDATPHGGESVRRLCRRTADWLDGLPADTGRVLVIAEETVVRALLVHVLSAPARAFWHLDAPALCTISSPVRDGSRAVSPDRVTDHVPERFPGRVADRVTGRVPERFRGRIPVHCPPGPVAWAVSGVADVPAVVRHVGAARATEARSAARAARRRIVTSTRPGADRTDVGAAG
ncbi:histidine phosphatase family protein [Streptomyces tirandamycinicus]|uniref:histidine phosphatase family protein n=1 Tax=Streptomyces tirandamycinicus TaxID=2174846 RepID=UPI00227199B7|nr:histidine phosphatase family protein [Streptomyces tirandamycinicus]MCY0984704.1 histidine phosphatase family protein [Streptomyces tirandamycinicus]